MTGAPPLDLVPIWTAILGLGVFLYVLLDGFDLGVGILFRGSADAETRGVMMNTIAPVWDGNETWLVLGGVALLSAFPLAFAVIVPAVYFPILAMLMARLVKRGPEHTLEPEPVESGRPAAPVTAIPGGGPGGEAPR